LTNTHSYFQIAYHKLNRSFHYRRLHMRRYVKHRSKNINSLQLDLNKIILGMP